MSTSTLPHLNEAIATLGAPRTAFFNGRLLSAEDLQREQALRADGDAALAGLIGCGIARGLQVSTPAIAQRLHIQGGLGVTPSGVVIEVPACDIDLSAQTTTTLGGSFSNCVAALNDMQAPGAGLYLLVLTPTWRAAGRAATLMGAVGACNRSVEQPAVRARLLPMSPPPGEPSETAEAAAAARRNRLAQALLGSARVDETPLVGWLPSDPFSGALDDDDLPLAAVQLGSAGQVLFVDSHAVQRRIAAPPGGAADALWMRSATVEMEAFGRQFAEQFIALLPVGTGWAGWSETLAAAFRFAPPVAVLDLGAGRDRAAQGRLARMLAELNGGAAPLARAEAAREIEDGLRDWPLATSHFSLSQYRVRAIAEYSHRWLLRRNDAPQVFEGRPPGRGEQSSPTTATVAAKVLRRKDSSAEERQLAASVLTQAPDKPADQARAQAPVKKARKPR